MILFFFYYKIIWFFSYKIAFNFANKEFQINGHPESFNLYFY